MSYYVVAPDGQKYGPADVAVLSQWAAENRLTPQTLLEEASTGQRMAASSVAGIVFPFVEQPTPTPGFATGPGQPMAQPGGSPTAGQPAGRPTQDWSQAPGGFGASPYPRGQYLAPGEMPYELKGKFNWGAFFLSWIWGLNHKAYLPLLIIPVSILSNVVPFGFVVPLGFQIWLGYMGNEWAWKSGRFQTVEHFRQVQRAWTIWGAILFSLGVVLGVLSMIFAAAMIGMSGGRAF